MPDPQPDARPLRVCMECGGLDDHPRHTQIVGALPVTSVPDKEFLAALPDGTPALAIAELLREGAVVRHIDCCAAKGCVLCAATEQVTGGARGQTLINAIANGALDDFEAPVITDNKEFGLDG